MVKQFAFQANNMSSSLITRKMLEKKFIKNKSLIWLEIRRTAKQNLKNKLKNYYKPINQQTVGLKKSLSFAHYYFLLQFLVKKGKKYSLEKIFKQSLIFWIQNYSKNSFLSVLSNAFNNLIPHVSVITKRKGSKNIYIPYKLSVKKGRFLATRWLVLNALLKKKRKFYEGILEELLECSLKTSTSIKKKEELLKLAEENLHNLKKKRKF